MYVYLITYVNEIKSSSHQHFTENDMYFNELIVAMTL